MRRFKSAIFATFQCFQNGNFEMVQEIWTFMHRYKSAILAFFHFFQNGSFEPVHEIGNFFLAESVLLKHYESAI